MIGTITNIIAINPIISIIILNVDYLNSPIKKQKLSKQCVCVCVCVCVCAHAQSCPTLCDPMDCSLPGSSVHGISQARILEWVAISILNVDDLNSPIKRQTLSKQINQKQKTKKECQQCVFYRKPLETDTIRNEERYTILTVIKRKLENLLNLRQSHHQSNENYQR